MKQDPTIGDIIRSVHSAPRRLLDVRVSTIWRGLALGIRVLLLTVAYVVIVLALGKVLEHWWHVPGSYYVIAFVLAPLSYVPSTEAPTACGETPVPVISPAVVNALAKLTGKRHRSLPLTAV